MKLVVVCEPSERGPLVSRCYRELGAAGMLPSRVMVVSAGTQPVRVEAYVGYHCEQWTALMDFIRRVGQLERVHSVRWTSTRAGSSH
jgi:hypothetical protein